MEEKGASFIFGQSLESFWVLGSAQAPIKCPAGKTTTLIRSGPALSFLFDEPKGPKQFPKTR